MTYTPVVPSNSFTGFGTSVFSIGDIGKKKDAHYKILEIIEESKKIYKKLFFDKGKFCGGILMGNVTKTGMMIYAKRPIRINYIAITRKKIIQKTVPDFIVRKA